MPVRVAVLTVSDRSSRGERPDLSSPALVETVTEKGWQVSAAEIVPDDQPAIEQALIRWCDSGEIDLILTTGGTGFAPRDITPEATLAVIQRAAPGLAEAMRLESLKVTPHAMLSRAIAGIRARTLIVTLPGSPTAVVENLNAVMQVIPHAVELLQERPSAEAGHTKI
jgi:molybdopterin adenylyltransferase